MKQQKLQLSALDLSDRMRSYRARPIEQSSPRGGVSHLRRRVGMDVWEPADNAFVASISKQSKTVKKITSSAGEKVSIKKVGQIKTASVQLKAESIKRINHDELDTHNKKIATRAARRDFELPDRISAVKPINKQSVSNTKHRKFFRMPKLSPVNFALYSMAVIVFLVGITAAVRSLLLDHKISQTVSAQSANDDGNNEEDPDETVPSDSQIAAYKVSPDLPRLVSIPKLGLKGRVRQMSVKGDGSLEAPRSIHDAGWYNQSAKPGSPGGAMLLDGHVSGPTQKGIFYKIETLKPGDIITVERGDGAKIDYKVVKVDIKKATEVDMAQMLVPAVSGTHGLNLITCTGKFNASSKSFEDRALVYSQFDRIY